MTRYENPIDTLLRNARKGLYGAAGSLPPYVPKTEAAVLRAKAHTLYVVEMAIRSLEGNPDGAGDVETMQHWADSAAVVRAVCSYYQDEKENAS